MQPLVIKDFQKALSASPHLGHALMRNIDIETFAGAMKVAEKLLSMVNISPAAVTITVNTGGTPANVNTASASLQSQAMLDNGNAPVAVAVTFTTTGTLPSFDFGSGGAPLVAGTVYYISYYSGDPTFKSFYLYDTFAKAIVGGPGFSGSPTANGSGTNTMTPVPMGTIMHIVKDPISSGNKYAIDSNGRVWKTNGGSIFYLVTGNTLTGAAGNGLAIFRNSDGSKSFLFTFRSAAIDILDLSSGTWTNNWKTLNSGSGSANSHFALVGQDNIIYYTDDRYLGSIQEIPGQVFDPSNTATYNFNSKALTFPQGEVAYCLEELGTNLLTGGLTFNYIYPWDRVSASFTLPIRMPETGIYRMKNAGSIVYILAGIKGNIYTSQGTYAQQVAQIPAYAVNNASALPYAVQWGGLAIRSGAVIMGVAGATTANSGVWILYPDGRVLQDNTPYGGSQIVNAIYADSDSYILGYAAGLDYHTGSRYAQGTFMAVYQSQLFRVGDKTHKAKYSELQVKIARPAVSGQMRFSYRFNESSAWVAIATYTANGTDVSFTTDCGITDVENIQVQAEFDSVIEMLEITLTP